MRIVLLCRYCKRTLCFRLHWITKFSRAIATSGTTWYFPQVYDKSYSQGGNIRGNHSAINRRILIFTSSSPSHGNPEADSGWHDVNHVGRAAQCKEKVKHPVHRLCRDRARGHADPVPDDALVVSGNGPDGVRPLDLLLEVLQREAERQGPYFCCDH